MGMLVSPARHAAPPTTFTTLDTADKESTITLSGGSLTALKNASNGDANVFAVHGKETGKWRFQVTVDTWGASHVLSFGLAGAMFLRGAPDTSGNNLAVIGSTGRVYLNGSNIISTGGFAVNDVFDFYVDLTVGTAWIYRNNVSISGDAALGTGGFSLSTLRKAVYPWANIWQSSNQVTFNFGATSFTYTGVAGFSGWSDDAAPATKTVFRTLGVTIRSAGFFAHNWAECEVMASSGGANILSGATGTHNATLFSGSMANGIDGNTATGVQIGSNAGVANQARCNFWYALAASATRNATHFAFRSIQGGGGTGQQCPTLFDVWWSLGDASGAFYKGTPSITFTTFADATPGTRKETTL